ncbi:hypothetical protein [Kribbella sp. NPDC048915]|uniref:hypothetical protein n=1 Tax=Kribbella sp. NPDC048915 TaxID=3155148 RepID=UPI0033E0FC44
MAIGGPQAPSAAAATPDRAEPSTAAKPGAVERHDVTLITGDRFTVLGVGTAAERVIVREPVRAGARIHRFRVGGRLHLVPQDALRPLGTGRLDLRLFDVASLIESGYADSDAGAIGLVVTGVEAPGGGRGQGFRGCRGGA